MAGDTVNIVYRVSAYSPNRDYHWPKPDGWGSMDKAAREAWAKQQLRKLNAQAIFIRVS